MKGPTLFILSDINDEEAQRFADLVWQMLFQDGRILGIGTSYDGNIQEMAVTFKDQPTNV